MTEHDYRPGEQRGGSDEQRGGDARRGEEREPSAAELDRLVDGELAADEYRELLRRLERHPHAWRQCALAFLEGQAWRAELPRAAARAGEAEAPAAGASPRPAAARGAAFRLGGNNMLALAACVLLAFGVGWLTRDTAMPAWPGAALVPADGASADHRVPHPDPRTDRTTAGVVRVEKHTPSTAAQPSARHVAAGSEQRRAPSDPSGGLGAVEMVRLMVSRPGGDAEPPRAYDLPLVRVDTLDERWFTEAPTSAPAEVVRELRQRGLLRFDRRVQRVRLGDGREMLVPLEHWEIAPAVQPASYQ